MPDALPQVSKVTPQAEFALEIHFMNGDKGRVYLEKHLPFTGYFAPLAQQAFFDQVFVDHGTRCWPNGIDFDPVVIHAWTVGQAIDLV